MQAAYIITDIQLIKAVVGCVHSCTEWAIIGHSLASLHLTFTMDNVDKLDDELARG